jgi:imidazolonepropionase
MFVNFVQNKLHISYLCIFNMIYLYVLPEEALVGMTINAAHALEMAHEVGSITPGKKANLIITDHIPSLGYIPYSLTAPWIRQVCINGQFLS